MITVQTLVHAPLEKAWKAWNTPEDIMQWAFASDDWEAPFAENDIRTGGRFKTTMAAKDKSTSFDFEGVYSNVEEQALIEYEMADGRKVKITFEETPEGVLVTESFDPENIHPEEMQRAGWQAILDNFKKHAEKA